MPTRAFKPFRKTFDPINPLLLAWVVSMSGATASDISGQRKVLFDKIQTGRATDTEVDQFIQLTKKGWQDTAQKFDVTTKQNDQTNEQLNRVEKQNEKINQALFGGVSIGSMGGSTSNTPIGTNISPLTNIDLKPAMPNVIGGLSLPLTPEVDRIANAVVNASVEGKVCNDALADYSKPFSKWWAGTKDMINYSMPYRGTAPSSLVADVVLDEKLKLNSLQACMYAKRKLIDDTRLTLTTCLFNAASTGGYDNLEKLTGKAESDHLRYVLSTHLNDAIDDDVNWDFTEKNRRYGNLVKTGLEHDHVVIEIIDALHKYNKNKNKSVNIAVHIIEPILGAAAYVPNFIAPIAHGVLCGLVQITGGPEVNKAIKELYLDKCLESRSHLMAEQARLSLDAYQQAIQQNNTVLFYCAKTLINEQLL